MRISELARRAGVTVHALRHYERLGLLLPQRTAAGYRDYPESMRREVVFIAMSRRIGFSLQAIGELLPAYRAGRLSLAAMDEALQQRAAVLAREIDALQQQRTQVLAHAAWLRAQQPRPAGQPAAAPSSSPWPHKAAGKEPK